MSSKLSCAEARELAPELALGIIAGDERARLITHVASCSGCRRIVEDLSITADSILLTAPEHEPPAGFESGVLARFPAPVRRTRLVSLVAAAAVVAALATGAGLLWITADDRELASHYRAALTEADGEYFGVKALRSDGAKTGNVFAYQGSPSWLFVVFDESVPEGTYAVEVETRHDAAIDLGSFELVEPKRTWGTHLDLDLRDVAAVQFVGVDGEVLEARFPAP
ncbi:MAG: zf-HC2 domain-containing protein [Actinomycetota bacterium]|nr:zf-HC2 domain-containing protein [Actinomycetota bacterium]